MKLLRGPSGASVTYPKWQLVGAPPPNFPPALRVFSTAPPRPVLSPGSEPGPPLGLPSNLC